jgi:anti-sigma factor RsiW
MTAPAFSITTDTLHAYVDGRLDAAERQSVEAYLGTNPDAASLVAQWRRQNEAISALFPPLEQEPLPERLKPALMAQSQRANWQHNLRNVAAAMALVIVAGSAGWGMRGVFWTEEPLSEHLIDNAVAAHTIYVKEQAHAVEAAADSPNLMRWLSNRIATPIDAPNLSANGFNFLGGRLLPGETGEHAHGPAAQLMYENASAERVTLYITGAPPDKKEVWKYEQRGDLDAYYWADADVTCTIVSDLPEDKVRNLGTAIFEQLTRKADSSWNPTGTATPAKTG